MEEHRAGPDQPNMREENFLIKPEILHFQFNAAYPMVRGILDKKLHVDCTNPAAVAFPPETNFNLGVDTDSVESLLLTEGAFWLGFLTDAIGTFHAKHIVAARYEGCHNLAFETHRTVP
ncbi:hypothetical protein JTE90_005805 [Oedothorax gibbosus]|uniref:Uncharacterized protein n=1 Tax=Oedothorax gibbosus TaxID=931172 RepID=A0AAV6UA47_9ARAC|nr:hypothetical protein JTE90_005805 [Oedothorax gibbosus]